ncbi:response regulator [archaeon]|nr:MAG: response regulator [archaeon]
MAGIELVDRIVAEKLHKLENGMPIDFHTLQTLLGSAHECLKNLSSTNHFMVMTINRCIQYTKASQGLKLVPVLETIDLQEALALPLRVMQDVQDRVKMTMVPLAEDLCRFVITDKQWLQENVLCLLSNAVKYSNSGVVSLRLSLDQASSARNVDETSSQNTLRPFDPAPPWSWWSSLGCGSTDRAAKNHVPLDAHDSLANTSSSYVDMELRESRGMLSSTASAYLLRIEVEDQGIGMSEETRAKLFAPFQQHQAMTIGSTGLGLFSLKKRVEALGGKCGVEGRRDGTQGSLFWFTIPHRPDHTQEEMVQNQIQAEMLAVSKSKSLDNTSGIRTTTSDIQSDALGDFWTASRDSISAVKVSSIGVLSIVGEEESKLSMIATRVLLVDDSPSIIKMTSMLFQKYGYHVTTATNGAMALEVIQAEQKRTGQVVVFDVVLMDLQMPIMDGIEAVKRLRALEKSCLSSNTDDKAHLTNEAMKHFVVGLSANSDTTVCEHTKAAGFDCFLPKPFQIDTFRTLFKRFLSMG